MPTRAKRNVDFLTYYEAPTEAYLPELHTVRWVLWLLLADGARGHGVSPLVELVAVVGRLLVCGSRPRSDRKRS